MGVTTSTQPTQPLLSYTGELVLHKSVMQRVGVVQGAGGWYRTTVLLSRLLQAQSWAEVECQVKRQRASRSTHSWKKHCISLCHLELLLSGGFWSAEGLAQGDRQRGPIWGLPRFKWQWWWGLSYLQKHLTHGMALIGKLFWLLSKWHELITACSRPVCQPNRSPRRVWKKKNTALHALSGPQTRNCL